MMAQVTIEGSLTPCTELAKGERKTVQLTKRIQRLIRKGYVVVIDQRENAAVAPDEKTPTHSSDGVGESQANTGAADPAAESPEPEGELPVPPANAKRDVWAKFLTSRNIAVPEDAPRDGLVEIWRQHTGGA
jgi:hypothetical protein